MLGSVKILSYSFIQKYRATYNVPGMAQAIMDPRVHWKEMAPAVWGWSHSLQCSWEPGVIFIPISPKRGMKVKIKALMLSLSWSLLHHPRPLTLQTAVLSTVPLASVLIRCGYFFFFLLTSRLIFLMLLNVNFLSCFSIAYSHFNYILLIAFCRWASYVFLFLPLVLKWCLHLLRYVCFAPASRSY